MARAPVALGTWQEGRVHVADQGDADRLAHRGLGTSVAGPARVLTPVEAAYAIEQRRLRVDGPDGPMGAGDVLAAVPGDPHAHEVAALAYHDLRGRGLLVRPADVGYHVWQRGDAATDPPWFCMHVAAATDTPVATWLAERAVQEDVLAVVDDEGGITHYRASLVTPLGRTGDADLPVLPGHLLHDRVLIDDPDAVAALRRHHLGSTFGEHQVLGLGEAHRLAEHLRLPGLDAAAVRARLESHDPEGARRVWPVQAALAAAGVHARSGLRFGTDLRGYEGAPGEDHAAWILQCVAPDEVIPWPQLARGVRLAHGVRKAFLLALATEPVQYVRLDWFRP